MALTACKEGLRLGVSRRALLQSGIAMTAMGLLRGWAFGVDAPASPELYVFRAPNSANTVIGLSIPADRVFSAPTNARIHVGTMTWAADLGNSARTRLPNDSRVRVFTGRGMTGAHLAETVVLELSARELAPAATYDVWAEISHGNKQRERVGNPIVTALVQNDQELGRIYHRISPVDDRAVLTPVVTRIIAARAKRYSIATNPVAYAERLAHAILPDAIRFKPGSPLGFSYAGQNGRHPAEKTAQIVDTLLGASHTPSVDQQTNVLFDHFPYLISSPKLT
ncbi:MAG TPA: hypothetical protein VMD58_10585 [Acidobacteriaceae bacterium]|nr:hypothetical protein [Acidobacteriaceae bacterium]